MTRSTQEVFDDHLARSDEGSWERDLAKNYATDVVVLTGFGIFRGRDGMRECTRQLQEELPDVTFEYRTRVVEGEFAFLEWTADSPRAEVRDGADSYVARDGRIVAQTIHYTVEPKSSSVDEV